MFISNKHRSIESQLDYIMSIEGQISREEALQLVKLSSKAPPKSVIVEIGSYRGRSSIALAIGSLQGHGIRVYAIDPHDCYTGVYGHKFGEEDQAILYENISRLKLGKIISIICLPSVKVSQCWAEKNISLLWIDGDHTYGGVAQDFECWSSFLINGAIVAFHDVSSDGVRKLTSNLVANEKLSKLGQIGELSWYEINNS